VVCGQTKRLSREVHWSVRGAGGNSSAAANRAGVEPVVASASRPLSSRGQQAGCGTLEFLQGRHVLRESKDLRLSWPGCGLRLLREVQPDSEDWTHPPVLPRPVRQSAVRNTNVVLKPLSGGRQYPLQWPSSGGDLPGARASFGKCGANVAHDANEQTGPLTGTGATVAPNASNRPGASFCEARIGVLCLTPAHPSYLLREVRQSLCDDNHRCVPQGRQPAARRVR